MFRTLLKAAAILVLTGAVLELACRIAQPNLKVFLFKGDATVEQGILKSKGAFVRQSFCDTVHQTAAGERATAECVNREIGPLLRQAAARGADLWTTGASSTAGDNCRSGTSWPQELARLNPGLKLDNLARDAQLPHESFETLEHRFASGLFPGVLLWTNGSDVDPQVTLPPGTPIGARILVQFLKADFYLLMKSRLYDLVRLTTTAALRRLTGQPSPAAAAAGSGHHLINSRFVQDSLERQERYVRALSQWAHDGRFTLVCVGVPTAPGTFPGSFIYTREEYDEHLARLSERTREICGQLGLKYVDVQSCYARKDSG